MDYLIEAITEVMDKLLTVKGYIIGKKLMIASSPEQKPKPKFTNHVIKFKDIIGREALNKEKGDANMNKKPRLGSIKKLKNKDLYRGRFQYKNKEYTTTAKKYIDCFNKMEALINEAMEEHQTIKESGRREFNKNMLLSEWWDYWYKTYKEPNLKVASKDLYEMYYRVYIKTNPLAKLKLHLVTTFDVQNLIDSIVAVSSKQNVKSYLQSCFKKAVETGLISKNPVVAAATIRKKRKSQVKPISDEGLQKIFDYCENANNIVYDELGQLYYFMLNTGCRVGEALAMRWDNINFEKKQINILESYNTRRKVTSEPKTESSKRMIPLFEELENALIIIPKNSEYIFPNLRSKRITNRARFISEKIGVYFTNHMFRHTFASDCLARGITPKTIQKWLGHEKLDMTMDTYADVTNELEINDIDKFNKK